MEAEVNINPEKTKKKIKSTKVKQNKPG